MTNSIKKINSNNQKIKAEVSLDGGMLSSLNYTLNDGTELPILYQAPWINDSKIIDSHSIPPLLKRLGGEWVAVPFGAVDRDSVFFYANSPHGLPINNHWQWGNSANDEVELSYHYPNDYPLQKLTRTIKINDDGSVGLSLSILARIDCKFPIGLHPIFPFGEKIGEVEIEIPNFSHGITYPRQTEPLVSRAAINARFTNLAEVPTINNQQFNLSKLPVEFNTEEIVQIIQAEGLINLYYKQHNLRISLTWDKSQLPDCLLWISNRGRSAEPWLNRNCCLGVEPICSAWDLGPKSLEPNNINQFSPTSLTFLAGKEKIIHYKIHCMQLEKEQ